MLKNRAIATIFQLFVASATLGAESTERAIEIVSGEDNPSAFSNFSTYKAFAAIVGSMNSRTGSPAASINQYFGNSAIDYTSLVPVAKDFQQYTNRREAEELKNFCASNSTRRDLTTESIVSMVDQIDAKIEKEAAAYFENQARSVLGDEKFRTLLLSIEAKVQPSISQARFPAGKNTLESSIPGDEFLSLVCRK